MKGQRLMNIIFHPQNHYLMKLFKVNQDAATSPSKITWVSILNAIVQAIIAALTALGVSSCCN